MRALHYRGRHLQPDMPQRWPPLQGNYDRIACHSGEDSNISIWLKKRCGWWAWTRCPWIRTRRIRILPITFYCLTVWLVNIMTERVYVGAVVFVENQLEIVAGIAQLKAVPADLIKLGMTGMRGHRCGHYLSDSKPAYYSEHGRGRP